MLFVSNFATVRRRDFLRLRLESVAPRRIAEDEITSSLRSSYRRKRWDELYEFVHLV